MLTQMDVGGVMACTHDHAPLSKRISPTVPSTAHKCTLSLPILYAVPRSTSLPVVTSALQGTYLEPERFALGRQLILRRFLSAIGQTLIFAIAWRMEYSRDTAFLNLLLDSRLR